MEMRKEKVLTSTFKHFNHQGNAHQNHNKGPPHIRWDGSHKKDGP